MAQHRLIAAALRIGAALVVVAGIGCFVLLMNIRAPITPEKLALPVLAMMLSIGASVAMLGLAALLSQQPRNPDEELTRALARVQSQLAELGGRISEQQGMLDRMARNHAPPPPPPAGLGPSDLEPLYQAIYEVRQLMLLPDGQRRERHERERRERRVTMIKQSFDLVATRQWQSAERVVSQLEADHPDDDEVTKARNYLDHSRRLHEQETVSRTVRDVEALMAAFSWEPALSKAKALADGFPDNAEAKELTARVARERKAFEESTVQRMFDELRHDIDRRMWRRALMHAERLLEQHPDHPRAEGVRRQLKTLQDNAEIEERQEQEVRIQELVKARRFNEAIELADDLIHRYPLSPQAESLETLLPRIRELAKQGVEEFSGLGPQVADEDVGFSERPV